MKRLTIDISPDLHQKFKLWCVQNGHKMNAIIKQLIIDAISAGKPKK